MFAKIAEVSLVVIFWLIAGALAMLIFSGPMSVMPIFGWIMGPVGGLLVLLIIARSARRVRRNRGTMVLNYLKQAVSLNLPIPPMLAAAQASEKGPLAWSLGAVCAAMKEGQSVGEALRIHVPEIPARTVDLILAGERIGRLPSTLENVTTEERTTAQSLASGPVLNWNYGVVLVLTVALILSFLSTRVMLYYPYIFEDFEVALPWQTVMTFEAIDSLGLPMLFVVMVAIMAVSSHALQQSFHGIEGAARPWRSVTDRLIWWTPVARSAARDRGLGDACRLITEALKAGDTVEAAAYEAGELKTNAVLRRRLRRFADALRVGQPLRDAAEDARLPKLMVGMLATGQAVSDPLQVFDFLGRYYANRFSRTATLIQASVLPGIVLTIALIVGWIVYSVMLPLAVLIDDAAMKVGTF